MTDGIDEAALDIVDQELADYENGHHVAPVPLKVNKNKEST